MLELIYASAAIKPFTESELSGLLSKARSNNAALGITGMLVYDRGSFLQVLEGAEDAVRHLFQKITRDIRHHRIVTLLETSISTRTFADWSMGFAHTDRLHERGGAGISNLLGDNFSIQDFLPGRPAARARQILLAFREGRWRTYVA